MPSITYKSNLDQNMANNKMPYLPEQTLKNQRVEIYLDDLKTRLMKLRLQQNEVINNSLDIIMELDEVSSNLLLVHNSASANSTDGITKTKLILEFETAKEKIAFKDASPIILENHVDIQNILQNFEKLNKSQLLNDSLLLFRQARESLDKIDTLLAIKDEEHVKNNGQGKQIVVSECIRDKTNMLIENKPQKMNIITSGNAENLCCVLTNAEKNNSDNNQYKNVLWNAEETNAGKHSLATTSLEESISNYASCCSSLVSIRNFKSLEDMIKTNACNHSLSGYDGDNDDSEFDTKQKK